MKKKDVLSMYRLPEKVLFCKKCTVSNQRPRISFDENGVCSACNYANYKKIMLIGTFVTTNYEFYVISIEKELMRLLAWW